MKLPATLVASLTEDFAKGPGNRVGRANSLKWPWLYDKLRAKGYDKSKAAAISNSRLKFRKKGRISVLDAKTAHNPAALRRLAAADKAGKHSTKGSLRASAHIASIAFACNDKSCAPPPTGTGGSKPLTSGGMGKATSPGRTFKVITADQARGDSRPVSAEEFQRLARVGQSQLDQFAKNKSPHTGLDQNWDAIKVESYAEVTKSWGGATIDAHTGKTLPQGENKYAITVKSGLETVSVSETASKQEFDAAMNQAKSQFSSILQRESHYLGVFHDDDAGRIDIDPVLVVSKSKDVETIGAASHAVGGAYNFRDGLGYWPPHIDTSPTATRTRDDYQRTYED